MPIIFKIFFDCFGRKNFSIKETSVECNLSYPTCQKLLDIIRTAITHTILKNQERNMIGGFEVDIEIDETMITHNDGVQIWLIGAVERNPQENARFYFQTLA